MLNVFKLKNNQLTRVIDVVGEPSALNRAVWIDVVEPNEEEYCLIRKELGNNLVNLFKLETIISNNKFFKDDNMFYICSFFLCNDVNCLADSVFVVFVIYNGKLFTLRKRDVPIFHVYQMYINSVGVVTDGNAYGILLDLFEVKLDHLANSIECIYSDLEKLGMLIMNGQQVKEYDTIFSRLAHLEKIGWKLRWCLLDTQRAINFLVRKTKISISQVDKASEILRDVDFLLPYNEVLLQKINFLIQATMGFINIEQNRIIRIFSVVFLPPTLVASSYGMNFEFMPELKWVFGYPGAIILMVLTGLFPYLYFKHKNWL
ncbi:magnesium/cobalt transporter CorA [Blochmannia endosymbiont of Camponotus (Colobopsis) obliquus]|uniref:magnesium/cobalt transporter CorA n=1 Tax=Blochmannia endosymbiont of Camponotus (Colobopsis) obliquus TaxID=1505597 RepID=UPI00061A861C|nr:magnesium/cobalt transporter CorA [Blochmannia endosymbiont of Camponotus (Colobopsis) obliquus]AKC60723.1 Magnesium transport protein CorA [Blochmannia endosymbiont of Camponotus (Colobopsis) obliquus]